MRIVVDQMRQLSRPFNFVTACAAFSINVSFVVVDMTGVGGGTAGTGVGAGLADPEPAGLITCKYPSLAHNDLC